MGIIVFRCCSGSNGYHRFPLLFCVVLLLGLLGFIVFPWCSESSWVLPSRYWVYWVSSSFLFGSGSVFPSSSVLIVFLLPRFFRCGSGVGNGRRLCREDVERVLSGLRGFCQSG